MRHLAQDGPSRAFLKPPSAPCESGARRDAGPCRESARIEPPLARSNPQPTTTMKTSAILSLIAAWILSAIAAHADPYRCFKFQVKWDGTAEAGGFTEVSGLTMELQPVEYREGGDATETQYLAGTSRHAPIVLKRPYRPGSELLAWMRSTTEGDVQPRDLSIVVVDSTTGAEVGRWECHGCLPVRWGVPKFDNSGSEVAIEELVLVAERIDIR